jgi:hypothetical protein
MELGSQSFVFQSVAFENIFSEKWSTQTWVPDTKLDITIIFCALFSSKEGSFRLIIFLYDKQFTSRVTFPSVPTRVTFLISH